VNWHEAAARRAKVERLARVLDLAAPGLTAADTAAAVACPTVRRDAESAAGTRPASEATWRQVADLFAARAGEAP
jgi:hypothetical protein